MLLYALPMNPTADQLGEFKLSLNAVRVKSSEPCDQLPIMLRWEIDDWVHLTDVCDLAVEVCGKPGVYIYRDWMFTTMGPDDVQLVIALYKSHSHWHDAVKTCEQTP